ncbi:hypothetical protein SCLCIDRAFT_1208887 [Scleroderma citrinum Foug A]|uniref:Zona occludens toxin N-terminal domain-containing protein n=1 Tax=Scleroderma citrinum Foug A TaxID=1036808 RepID=A0A0C3EKH2_9AGAM|nr:hypothetical protein SCLCIDRAFT_1208887 [Scleroderma citrinum Foug A]
MAMTNGSRLAQPVTNGFASQQPTSDAAYDELLLLSDSASSTKGRSKEHELRTAPIITRDAYVAAGYHDQATQYGVLGRTMNIFNGSVPYSPIDPRLYVNTNAPFSAVICGVQGSGKSHTVSVLLENMFIPNLSPIGTLRKPLSGLVLHFGEGGASARPCEAAWTASSDNPLVKTPKVKVYVSRSSLRTMTAVYAPLGNKVTVEPLLFDKNELDAQAFLSMMAVGSSESAPLYIQGVLSILRDLGEDFTYERFMEKLNERKETFNPAQIAGLEQRMALLKSLLDNAKGARPKNRFAAGQLTIIDLSDPFIDPASACGLFDIILRLFVRVNVQTGKVLVVDEAHKYLSPSKAVSGLTKSLLTLTREQRHLAMRVIISTQEPTVIPPVLLDLCTVSILHRFSSPSWWEHLSKHVSADISGDDAFSRVVKLETGEAIVLAPSGFGVFPDAPAGGKSSVAVPKLNQFGRRYLLMKTRRRVTQDGGSSILVIDE